MFNVQRSTFKKAERIVSRKQIETLFGGGTSQSLSAFPLRVVFMTQALPSGEAPVQILVSVPKKHFKHAVDRNRVKRQVREAYRHHKQLLSNTQHPSPNTHLSLAFIWLSDHHHSSAEIEKRVVSLLKRIADRL